MSEHWKDRAISTWRHSQLQVKIRSLLEVDIDPSQVAIDGEGSSVVVDGVTFRMLLPDGSIVLEGACPSCGKPQRSGQLETIADVGKALDSPCRDCDFLVKSGLKPGGAAKPAV
ncbi:MAG: hypothetical protein KGJ86_03280 [Chloroflexota bacterium]|nr:hypothetical protein [Chloroflexota bacterium]